VMTTPVGTPWVVRLHAACVLLLVACAMFLEGPALPVEMPDGTPGRVAVVGGGIAGSAAAWSLARRGYHVELFEKEAELGGNAKTNVWKIADGTEIRTGLSVLAWPRLYFNNYRALLDELQVASEPVNLRFLIGAQNGFVGHDVNTNLSAAFADDFARWNRARDLVRRTNAFLSATPEPTLYAMSLLNPFNLMSLRTLVTRFYGVSPEFWQTVVVSVYSSSFLTTKLDDVPAVILPTIDDLIGLSRTPVMDTWTGDSQAVFSKMAAHPNITVHLNANLTAVETQAGAVLLRAGRAQAAEAVTAAHRVVFACPASEALRLIAGPSTLHRWLLGSVAYTDHYEKDYARGQVHSDTSVLPAEWRGALLANYSNYIRRPAAGGYVNTFILSSWVPRVQQAVAKAAEVAEAALPPPMLVTYNQPADEPLEDVQGEVHNINNHPCLCTGNLVLVFVLRLVQGTRGLFFCGAHTTPGNGHDLSLLSGLAAANRIGAGYPFERNAQAAADFGRLRAMMGL
jgi:predicted NAD/FAD-binding protein